MNCVPFPADLKLKIPVTLKSVKHPLIRLVPLIYVDKTLQIARVCEQKRKSQDSTKLGIYLRDHVKLTKMNTKSNKSSAT